MVENYLDDLVRLFGDTSIGPGLAKFLEPGPVIVFQLLFDTSCTIAPQLTNQL